jgi:hypothetical protein
MELDPKGSDLTMTRVNAPKKSGKLELVPVEKG